MMDEFDEEDEDTELALAASHRARDEAFHQRGIEDRAFYDDLAKKEDERHNAMKKDIAQRSLELGELRQKLRHRDTALRTIQNEIAIERDRID